MKMSDMFHTHNIRGVPYHPASQGQVERVHALIDQVMEKLMEGNTSLDEDTALVWAVASYNAATMTTGFSPAQLVFGVTNTEVDFTDYDVMDMVEHPVDKAHRFMEDFAIRREARETHQRVKNSMKLKTSNLNIKI